jgi:hypothetical protein
MSVAKKYRFGILFQEDKTDKLNEISMFFKKSPEKFLNDIIDSTYEKIQIISLEWEDD